MAVGVKSRPASMDEMSSLDFRRGGGGSEVAGDAAKAGAGVENAPNPLEALALTVVALKSLLKKSAVGGIAADLEPGRGAGVVAGL